MSLEWLDPLGRSIKTLWKCSNLIGPDPSLASTSNNSNILTIDGGTYDVGDKLQIDVAGVGSGGVTAAQLDADTGWTHLGVTPDASVTSGNVEIFDLGGGFKLYIDQALFTNGAIETI